MRNAKLEALVGTWLGPPVSSGKKGEDQLAGTFEIKRIIGVGGMAHVFEAIDHNMSRRVAIKVTDLENQAMNPDQLGELRTRLSVEVKALGSLTDVAGVVNVYSSVVDADRGISYIVMQYIDGQSLDTVQERLKEESGRGCAAINESNWPWYGKFIGQVLLVLDQVNDLGVCHRDVKPSNILCVADKMVGLRPVLIDCGIALRVNEEGDRVDARATKANTINGTFVYMAPEQHLGYSPVDPTKRQIDPDGRADQYAVAVMVFEALTDRFPRLEDLGTADEVHDAEMVVKMTNMTAAYMENREPQFDLLPPWVPEVVKKALRRALQLDRVLRFPNNREFAAAFYEAAGEQIPRALSTREIPLPVFPVRREAPSVLKSPDAHTLTGSSRTMLLTTPAPPRRRPQVVTLLSMVGGILLALLIVALRPGRAAFQVRHRTVTAAPVTSTVLHRVPAPTPIVVTDAQAPVAVADAALSQAPTQTTGEQLESHERPHNRTRERLHRDRDHQLAAHTAAQDEERALRQQRRACCAGDMPRWTDPEGAGHACPPTDPDERRALHCR